MCKYCDSIKEDNNSSFDRMDIDLLDRQGVGTDLIIIKKEDKFYFNIIDSLGSIKESVEIEFCPVCGRKLNGELCNYSADYSAYEQTYAPTSGCIPAWQNVSPYSGYCGETYTTSFSMPTTSHVVPTATYYDGGYYRAKYIKE